VSSPTSVGHTPGPGSNSAAGRASVGVNLLRWPWIRVLVLSPLFPDVSKQWSQLPFIPLR
jgi:hypothetical protein